MGTASSRDLDLDIRTLSQLARRRSQERTERRLATPVPYR
jgi:hypothetical protein